MRSVDDNGDDIGLRGTEFHSSTVLVARYRDPFSLTSDVSRCCIGTLSVC